MAINTGIMPVTRGGLASSSAARQTSTSTTAGVVVTPGPLDLDLLWKAARQVRQDASPGIDGVTGADFNKTADIRLPQVRDVLLNNNWRPRPTRRAWIPKGQGERRGLGIPCHEDKVVGWMQVMALEPGFEAVFLSSSYGFRPEIGTIDACKRIRDILNDWQGAYVLDADIRQFFDTIDHGLLMGILKKMKVPKFHRRLIYRSLKAGVMDKGQFLRTTQGTPQGGVASPLLSNVYLHVVLDVWFAEIVLPTLTGRAELVRYADDFVILFEREAEARQTWKAVGHRLRDFGLRLHDEKTRFIDCHLEAVNTHPTGMMPRRITDFSFLGFNFKMVDRTDDPTLVGARVKVTTSEITIKKTVQGWPRKAEKITGTGNNPRHELRRLLRFIRTSVGGFLAYQDFLSDDAGLLCYLEAIRPVIVSTLRKAKANHVHLDWLADLLAPENIPVLIREARHRGRWHKDTHGNWRTRRDASVRVREDAGGRPGCNPPPEGRLRICKPAPLLDRSKCRICLPLEDQ